MWFKAFKKMSMEVEQHMRTYDHHIVITYTTQPKVFVHLKIACVVFGHFSSKLLFGKQNRDFVSIYIDFLMLGIILGENFEFLSICDVGD